MKEGKKEKGRTRMKGKASTHPAMAHSFRITSVSLLIGNGCATVLVWGKISGRLLKPYATAASSIMSTSWKMSGRVHGSETIRASGSLGERVGDRVMRVRSDWIVEDVREREVQELMYDVRAVTVRGVISGDMRVEPSGKTILQGSILQTDPQLPNQTTSPKQKTHVKGSAQYSENILATILITICNFVSSVAVVSMNTFLVSSVILLCSELIMGGILST
jgi:hypothetical protein